MLLGSSFRGISRTTPIGPAFDILEFVAQTFWVLEKQVPVSPHQTDRGESMIVPVVEEAEWMGVLEGLPKLIPAMKRIVIVAPHPDDETLGAGGLIAAV